MNSSRTGIQAGLESKQDCCLTHCRAANRPGKTPRPNLTLCFCSPVNFEDRKNAGMQKNSGVREYSLTYRKAIAGSLRKRSRNCTGGLPILNATVPKRHGDGFPLTHPSALLRASLSTKTLCLPIGWIADRCAAPVTAFYSKAIYLRPIRMASAGGVPGLCVGVKPMKKFLLVTVALTVVVAALPARAADLGARGAPYYQKAPAYVPQSIYNWTGFYIGGHIGGAFSSDNNFNGLATGNNGNGRFLGGVQVGADWQFAPNWVLGAQGQYSWLGGHVGATFPGGFAYNNNQRGLGSVTGRVGYTWGPGLVYVKGGYAYSDNNESVTLGGAPIPFVISGDHRNGYTVGAGLEYMFAPSW